MAVPPNARRRQAGRKPLRLSEGESGWKTVVPFPGSLSTESPSPPRSFGRSSSGPANTGSASRSKTGRPPGRAARMDLSAIVGASEAAKEMLHIAVCAAQSDASVLLLGETGTGKEMLAKTIHANSLRARGPFIPVDCAALPEPLLESELFGHERGAFGCPWVLVAMQRAKNILPEPCRIQI
ncbi:MAG: sigma 54-interacting transcriptional regulator [Acidobacteriia bacterium]|nr:sigma 54-interacting transcriptional regulator [Terriglobia bacterium]